MKYAAFRFLRTFGLPAGAVLAVAGVGTWYYRHQTVAAQRQETRRMMGIIERAVEDFRVDYDSLPRSISTIEGRDGGSDTSREEGLVLLLPGHSATLSIRRHDYLSPMNKAVVDGGRAVGGIVRTEEGAEIVDPWGGHFKLWLDFDFDGRLTNPMPRGNPRELSGYFVIWSGGPDGDFDTWGDNVVSWGHH